MPPKKSTDGESASSLNEGDSRFIKAMFDNMNSRPDIDWDKLGQDMSMTPKSAKERLRKMSKRYNWNTDSGAAGGSAGGSPAKTKGPLAPKNTGKVAKTTTPKKKGTAQKKGKSKKDESDDDEDVSSKLGSDSDGKAVAQEEFAASHSDSDE